MLFNFVLASTTTNVNVNIGPKGAIAAATVLGLIAIVVIVAFAIWIYALLDILKRKDLDPTRRVLWILFVFFLHLLGAIIYLLFGREKVKA